MITGSCHCGKTSFWIDAGLPERVTRCTCSICAKRGVLHAYYTPAQFSVTSEAERVYRFNTQLVESAASAVARRTTRAPRFDSMAAGTATRA